jgi:hypothetical protein
LKQPQLKKKTLGSKGQRRKHSLKRRRNVRRKHKPKWKRSDETKKRF